MAEYKNHHHVPEFVLHNFKGPNGLYYFNKKFPHKGIEKRNPKSIFRIPHLYSFREKDGNLNPEVEFKHFKKVDDEAAIVIQKIISKLRANEYPDLDLVEKKKWSTFFINQFARSSDRILSAELNTAVDILFEKEIQFLTETLGANHPSLMAFLSEPDVKKRITDTTIKQSLMKNKDNSESMSVLNQRGLTYAITHKIKSFIIGSSPLVREPSSGHLADPKTQWWYPISHDTAISIGSFLPSEREKIISLNQNNTSIIRRINIAIATQSNELASHSFLQLKLLLVELGMSKYIYPQRKNKP